MERILIIGGVAGGATIAARLRRDREDLELILFEKGNDISYANCGLPYYIGGEIKERETLFVQTPGVFGKKFNIDIRVRNEVIAIDTSAKTVTVKNLDTGDVYNEAYDKLVLSPGAAPVIPPIPGIRLDKVFTLRNVSDTDKIKNELAKRDIKKAVVVGAGFIGLEMAENLHNIGIKTSIVELGPQVMPPLDFEIASVIHQHIKMKNVELFLNDGVAKFEETGDGVTVTLGSGKTLYADIVVLSIGVRANSELAKKSGIKIGTTGGIEVNGYLQTSDENIYALGDAIEFENPIIKKKVITYLAGPANKQARIAADNIAFGNNREYKGAINTAIAKVFDMTAAATGVCEKVLDKNGIERATAIIHIGSHAGYYPGALQMSMKIIFDKKTGKLLGGQVAGYEGVDKRVDLLATVIKNNGTIYDLQEIEHAYAPPYSSAKDPVNIAGFTAENIMKNKLNVVEWYDVAKFKDRNAVILDVRTDEEFKIDRIPGAVNVPLDTIRDRINEFDKNREILVYCGVGLRGYVASRIFIQNGFTKVYNLNGGLKTYETCIVEQSNVDIFVNEKVADEQDLSFNSDLKREDSKKVIIDACGLQCPGPIMKLKSAADSMQTGDFLEIAASDPGFYKDAESWCRVTGNKLVSIASEKGIIKAVIEKGAVVEQKETVKNGSDDKTLVVFSDDFDRALASFVIANGAASMGKKVTMFFTFWGLNVIKKPESVTAGKDLMGKMFGWMLPSSSKKLKLSKMNMLGLGTKMMRNRMDAKKVESLENMIDMALKNGIKFIACQMSMDIMGVKAEELMDGVEIGGVASYLEKAEQSNVNLFV